MSVIKDNLKKDINAPDTLKSVTAVLKSGVPHTVYKGSLHVNDEGDIVFYDILESSKINEARVYSIWFEKLITVNILTEDRRSFEIIGRVKESITQGRKFEEVYKKLKQDRDNDLNAIWVIEPIDVRNESFAYRKSEQERIYPFLKHLDRAVK